MAVVARTIRQWFGTFGVRSQRRRPSVQRPPAEPSHPDREEAARSQLQGHIDEMLLQGFLNRSLSRPEHGTVINHLNACENCREAIAIVLVALDDPKAAAEMELERKRRLEQEEPWHKQALRWSALIILLLALLGTTAFLSRVDDPGALVGRWFTAYSGWVSSTLGDASAPRVLEGSFGQVINTKFEPPRIPDPKPVSGKSVRQPGWDTGPAPYVGNVAPSGPYTSVAFPPEPRELSAPGSPAVTSSPNYAGAPAASGDSSNGDAAASRSTARRRLVVEPDGSLKRTLDGGDTWQKVVIAPNLAFTSLALSGRTVWAAGASGALYRSQDAAEHWQQVNIRFRGETFKDDIEGIQFYDPQHGYLVTADGRVWNTADAGHTWVLDPSTVTHP